MNVTARLEELQRKVLFCMMKLRWHVSFTVLLQKEGYGEMSQECKTQAIQIHKIELPTHFPVGPVNVYVLMNDKDRILVDCGPKLDVTKKALISGLEELKLSVDDITAVVLTHGHVDHVGLSSLFQSHHVPVYAHRDVASWLDPNSDGENYRQAFFEQFYPKMGVPKCDMERALKEFLFYRKCNDRSVVDFELVPGERFAPMPMFEILHVPGHAQAAIALWCKETGQLVVGDQLLPHISSNAVIEPVPGARSGAEATRTKSLIQYRNNLKSLADLPIQTVYPGHGQIFTEAHELILFRLKEQDERKNEFFTRLQETGPVSPYELALSYFPTHQDETSLILSETLGYLDWLVAEGLAMQTEGADGIYRFEVC